LDTIWTDIKISQPQLSQPHFEELRQLIYKFSGIYFSDQKHYLLEGRLSKFLRDKGLKNFDEYLAYLKRVVNLEQELRQVYEYITINETYFFRYDRQLQTCVQDCIPSLMKIGRGKERPIKIWSAGCSSGEEPYSLAILLEEHFNGQFPRPNVEILGTDINNRVLNKARDGVYATNSIRNGFPSQYLSKYFQMENGAYRIRDVIKHKVRFEYLNLNDLSRIEQLRGQDVIFCRNVLIYFDDAMKRKVVRAFYDTLNHNGYLFLGEAESLHGISAAFEVIHFQGGFCYRKE
jgi:chemotaxis protein methyltransferase CheR